MKKIRLFLIIIFIFSLCNVMAYASENETQECPYEAKIVEEIKSLTGLEFNNYEIITLKNTTSYLSDNSIENEKAIKITGNKCVTIIVPKITEENNIINSFDYAESISMARDSNITVSHLVDITVNISAYFDKTANWNPLITLYTPKSLKVTWNSNNSTAFVDDINVVFDANGNYWQISPLTDLGYEKYVTFEIAKTNPQKGVTYSDSTNALPNNYGLECTNYFDHGGIVWYKINYTVNGVTRYDTYSWTVFSK